MVWAENTSLTCLKNINLRCIGQVQTKSGEAALSCYAACNYNKLPEDLRCAPNVAIFKSRLLSHVPMIELDSYCTLPLIYNYMICFLLIIYLFVFLLF